ncbi:hypothetical protein FEM48_Zijuj05G0150600 [Ziziphus jujuba var. spinosa]|uniref:pectinesterase n=1 Tax=Ziziphus jujuba var. spinosa TaxID=714518 RepID=A0A978VFI1_ZIZJJ|nr:hypothetical protein FEM48_Zijuj05G0150600 [Ziziphus jujuba var. spinosa]
MDSINFAKGYGKVNSNHLEVEDRVPNSTNPHPKIHQKRLVAIFALLLLSLLIGLMVGALIHESNTESPESPSSSTTNSAQSSLRAVCNVTRYPDSCFSSISSLNNPPESDPEAIFKLSLRVSIAELTKVSSSLKAMNQQKETALSDCQGQIEGALSQLNDSVSAMEVVGPGEKMLTEGKIRDIQTWISAAVTDQDTCLDGLEEMGSTFVDEVKKMMQKSKEYTSNALAIVANFNTILQNLHVSLH